MSRFTDLMKCSICGMAMFVGAVGHAHLRAPAERGPVIHEQWRLTSEEEAHREQKGFVKLTLSRAVTVATTSMVALSGLVYTSSNGTPRKVTIVRV